MDYELGEILEIDNKKYIILTIITDGAIDYAFVNQITDDEEDVTHDFYLYKIESDNTFTKVVDDNLVQKLYPKIQEGLKKSMDEVGIDYNSLLEQQEGE